MNIEVPFLRSCNLSPCRSSYVQALNPYVEEQGKKWFDPVEEIKEINKTIGEINLKHLDLNVLINSGNRVGRSAVDQQFNLIFQMIVFQEKHDDS